MENKKKNNGTLVGILIGLVIALIIGGCLLATGTMGFKTNKDINNEQSNKNNQTETTDSTTSNNTMQETTTKYFYDVKDLKVKALPEYQAFNNISENINSIETIYLDDYQAYLNLSGKVTVHKYSKSENEKEITNNLDITNVIDIIKFNIPATDNEQMLYMLTDNGDIYYYKFGDIEKNSFNTTKVENVSNVKKIFISNFTKTNAGGSWALFAITGNNDCIMIKGESV